MTDRTKYLVSIVEYEFDVDIYKKTNKRVNATARGIICNILHNQDNYGISTIGRMFNLHHSTAFYWIKKIDSLIKHNDDLNKRIRVYEKYESIINLLEQRGKQKDINDYKKILTRHLNK